MYVKQIDKNLYKRDWIKELEEVAYLIGIGAVAVINIVLAVLIVKSF